MSMPLRSARPWAQALAVLAIVAAPSAAHAQTTTTFAVDRLVMAGAPGDGFAVWRPDMADQTRFFGQIGLGYAVNPLRKSNITDNLNNIDKLNAAGVGNPLSGQLNGYLDAGVELFSRVSLQVAFPFTAYQGGSETNPVNVLGSTMTSVDLKAAAPGDLRVEGRVVLFRSESRAFKLGLNAALYTPTGNKLSFTGDDGFGGAFGLAAEYDFKVVAFAVNASYRLRPTVAVNELVVGSEVLWAAGAYVPFRRGTIRLGAEFFGGIGAGPTKEAVNSTPPRSKSNVGEWNAAPAEAMLNARMYFTPTRQIYAGLGAGGRLNNGYSPDFRAVALFGGSFGITDSNPGQVGSRYVFEVSDTKDTDHDGIPDEVDACPLEPGEMSSDPEKIGCPRYIRRVKGSNEIEVLKRIEFEFDRSVILPVSYPILDEIVRLLEANPTIKHMDIEGHTDNQGTPEYNQKLSEDRAQSVMSYLVSKGIVASRVSSKGFGLTRPRATNDTDAGRQQNRRVEFHITEQIGASNVVSTPPPATPAPTPAPAPPSPKSP